MRCNLKQRLKQGEPLVGTMINLVDNPDIAKIVKVCGFDFFIIDFEHGYFDNSKISSIFAVAREVGIPGLIRIPEVKREIALRAMEMGAAGILLPQAETVEQARALVEYTKYAPLGNRGVAMLKAHTGFEEVNTLEYMRYMNEESVLMLQIETPLAVENIDELMSVEGIDAAFVGPNDLTQSMGIMGQRQNPMFLDAMNKIIETAKKHGKYSGIHLMNADELKVWIENGMTLNMCGNDITMLMNSGKQIISKLKK